MARSERPSRQSIGSPTRAERYAAGKALRRKVPRSAHRRWVAPRDRADPIAVLQQTDRNRIPELLPIRYRRMSLSAFSFFRGAAAVMARDLASTPVTGLRAQLCGDAHLANFGVFATPERDQVFDVNDFDETLPGPWEWDVKRLATSVVLAGRQNGFARAQVRRSALAAVRAYRERMASFATMRYLDIWYAHLDPGAASLLPSAGARRLVDRAVKRARRRTGFHAFPRMVRAVRGTYRLRDVPPLIVHDTDRSALGESRAFFDRYLASLPDERRVLLDHYRVVDAAQKVVGVGSVGTACAVILLMGDRDAQDPLLLQLKEAVPSALEPYVGASVYSNHAQRVVVGQHLIQEASDIFLGWSRLRSRDFYVRQLRDMKFSSDLTTLGAKSLLGQSQLCGTALARAHARTGDPAAISGYLGTRVAFDEAVARFADAYADQSEEDHRALRKAIRRGRLVAAPDAYT